MKKRIKPKLNGSDLSEISLLTEVQPLNSDIILTPSESDELNAIETAAIKLKMSLAELAQQQIQLQETVAKTATSLTEIQKTYVDKVKNLQPSMGSMSMILQRVVGTSIPILALLAR